MMTPLMRRHHEGILWIGMSILLLIALVDYIIPEVHIIWPAAFIGFGLGYVTRRIF